MFVASGAYFFGANSKSSCQCRGVGLSDREPYRAEELRGAGFEARCIELEMNFFNVAFCCLVPYCTMAIET